MKSERDALLEINNFTSKYLGVEPAERVMLTAQIDQLKSEKARLKLVFLAAQDLVGNHDWDYVGNGKDATVCSTKLRRLISVLEVGLGIKWE